MFTLRKPSVEDVARFLDSLRRRSLSYSHCGITRAAREVEAEARAVGYAVDRYSTDIGAGVEAFRRARERLLRWGSFDLGWVELHGPTQVEPGADVAVMVRLPGCWSLNGCRVVYLDDEGADPVMDAECAFAYGTLPGHAEAGEERFSVRWDAATDRVSYSIVAVSKPALLTVRLGAPLARRLQRRFGKASLEAMRRPDSRAPACE